MKCPNCGFESNDNLNFCGACGYRLNFTEVGDQEQKGVKNRDQMGVRNWKNYPESSPPPSPDNSYLTPDNDNGKKKNNHKKKKLIFIIVPILLIVLGLFELYLIQSKLKDKTSKTKSTTAKNYKLPKNPRIESDSSMLADQKVTWDCIWFGSYPQTEIVDIPETSGVHGKDWEEVTDYEVNASLYNNLKSATGWNSNGDITYSGVKYRRIKKSDATCTFFEDENIHNYEWNSSDTWHYFRYDKIKWRVLNVSGDQALLLSDLALDDQRYYNINFEAVTWETSNIRSWLNGYDEGSNADGTDYSNKNFIGSAFSSAEWNAIQTTQVVNDDNISYGTEGGEITSDKVFLLSESEAYSDAAKKYGFVNKRAAFDEARTSKSTTYAKAMGIYSDDYNKGKGYCCWWLRSPGMFEDFSLCVQNFGNVSSNDVYNDDFIAVRPALNLNLSSSDLWSKAGTVCSDEIGGENGTEGD